MSRKRGKSSGYLKDHLYIVQGGVCAYCRKFCTPSDWNVDHVVPLSKGGSNARVNKIGSCKACNTAKADQLGYFPQWTDEHGFLTDTPTHVRHIPSAVTRKKPDWLVS